MVREMESEKLYLKLKKDIMQELNIRLFGNEKTMDDITSFLEHNNNLIENIAGHMKREIIIKIGIKEIMGEIIEGELKKLSIKNLEETIHEEVIVMIRVEIRKELKKHTRNIREKIRGYHKEEIMKILGVNTKKIMDEIMNDLDGGGRNNG